MTPRILEARLVDGYRIALRYDDGLAATVDLEPVLEGEIFEPLREPRIFGTFRIDTDFDTLVWPNGADLAPEFLYELAL